MKNRLVIFWVLIMLFVPACAEQPTPPPPTVDPLVSDSTPKPVNLTTEDSLALKATYYPPTNLQLKAPVLLLVHMVNSSREAWQGFALTAQREGYAVLTIDLRGHGESDGSPFFEQMDQDLDAAIQWLRNRPEVDSERIGLAGASLGANLALRAGSRFDQVKSVAMLSPGLEYRGVTTIEALQGYGQRPVMFVAAEQDIYAADSARTLNSQSLGQHQLQIYPGADHGTALLQAQAGLQPMLLAWFKTTL